MKIAGIRSGLIGDSVMALPILVYLKDKIDYSSFTWIIGARFYQSLPIYLGNPNINSFFLCCGPSDTFSYEDKVRLEKGHHIVFNVTPGHPTGDSWYGQYTCVEETFRMAFGDGLFYHLLGFASLDAALEDFKKRLPAQERKPRLYKWWRDGERMNQTIGIWPCAGYNQRGLARNPSQDFYQKLIAGLQKSGYKVAIFGHPNDFDLSGDLSFRHLPFFDQVKASLETDLIIGTDSGSSWIFGAYGHPQINLIRDGYPYGREDFWPLDPPNYRNNSITMTHIGSWNSLTVEGVLNNIKTLDI